METCHTYLVHTGIPSFNSATTFRLWKLVRGIAQSAASERLQFCHNLSVMETQWAKHFCSYPMRLQFCHNLSVMETASTRRKRKPRSSSFNSATTFRLWKRENCGKTMKLINGLQFCHNLSVMETRTVFAPPGNLKGFNSATTFRLWKPAQESN